MRFRLSAAVLAALIALPCLAARVPVKPVPVTPQEKDAHTLLLATFDDAVEAADFAKGSPALMVVGAEQVPGHFGKAIHLGKNGSLRIAPAGNVLESAGTIEFVLKDTNATARHQLVYAGSTGTQLMIQMGGSLWFTAAGAGTWVRDVDLRNDFPREWMYIVVGWDTAQNKATSAIYTVNGRRFANNPMYHSTAEMAADQKALLLTGLKQFIMRGDGLVIDALRISDTYRADLLDPERDWGPVEQWSNYSGASPLFDMQTLLKAWTAGETRVAADRVTPFAPMIRNNYKPTDQRKPAVSAWRCSPGTPTFDLDFGTLDIGCYVVRVIAAVKTEDIEQYRKPVFVDFRVNDRVGGDTSWYRHRVPYWDDFYAVTELYFNVDEKRAYRGTVSAGQGGLADLYIHRIEFHDVFAGLPRKAVKTKPALYTYAERERLRQNIDAKEIAQKVYQETSYSAPKGALTPEQRRARDDVLWNAFPPINSQFVAEYDEGFFVREMRTPEMTPAEAAKEYGNWALPGSVYTGWTQPLVFTNDKLKLTYTREDLAAHRPLPDPYPFKDAGLGVYFPQKGDMPHATHFLPLATQLGYRWESCWRPLAPWHGEDITYRVPYLYHALGNKYAARDAALLLARWAWTYPTHTDQQTLGYALIAPASMYNRDMRLTMRAVMFYWGSPRGANLIGGLTEAYDYLFDYIQGNDEFAQAVGRYVPWVKTEADVRRLIETRLLQFGARQTDRYWHISSKSHAQYYLHTILVQQDPDVTRPWMESLWKRTHIYPHGDAGLPDFISGTTQRDGTTDIGSVFYAHGGSPFLNVVAMTRRYVENGGDARFDLSGPEFGAKMNAGCGFFIDSAVAGGYPLTIGDVGGPYKPRLLYLIENWEQNARYGWEWTHEPRYAGLITRYYGRRTETDEDWAAIEAASKAAPRNPFFDQPSRVLANWAGILESGRASDDFRFKRSVNMRVGIGHGHAHGDTLDLQMLAHGVRVLNDVGHRGSYGQPSPGSTILHNVVEVNGDGGRGGIWSGHAHVPWLVAADGAQVMEGVAAVPRDGIRDGVVRTRTVALIDVDAGTPGKGAPAPLPYTDKTAFDPDAVTPNSYLFDVQRVDGGKVHTFCFHGTYSDDFAATIDNKSFEITGEDVQYLRKFLRGDVRPYVGDAPDTLVATWRLRRSGEPVSALLRYGKAPVSIPQHNAEQAMLGGAYTEGAPRVFTRLHLLGQKGKHEMIGWNEPLIERVQMTWPFLMVQERGEKLSNVFPAVIEPYRGEPFIERVALLDIPGNTKGANAAVAVAIQLKNGRTDLCFADARSDTLRSIQNPQSGTQDTTVSAKYAYVSRDANGLRMVQLVGGTKLDLPEGTFSLPTARIEATVKSVDYFARKVTLDRAVDPKPFVGAVVEFGNDAHRTGFTVVNAANEHGATVLIADKAIDLGYSAVTGYRMAKSRVGVRVAPVAVQHDGKNAGLTCTNAAMTKSWRCRYAGRDDRLSHVYELEGDFTEEDLPVGGLLRVWEFGPGDTVHLATHATLRRDDDGTLKVESPFAANWRPK